jgi:hypothetical protein
MRTFLARAACGQKLLNATSQANKNPRCEAVKAGESDESFAERPSIIFGFITSLIQLVSFSENSFKLESFCARSLINVLSCSVFSWDQECLCMNW